MAARRATINDDVTAGDLALEATARGLPIERLELYETRSSSTTAARRQAMTSSKQVQAMVASDRRGAAIKRFMSEAARVPALIPLVMSLTPVWPRLKAIAHTLPYDITILADYQKGRPLPGGPWTSVTGADRAACRRQEPYLDEERRARSRRHAAPRTAAAPRPANAYGQTESDRARVDRMLHLRGNQRSSQGPHRTIGRTAQRAAHKGSPRNQAFRRSPIDL